MPEPQTVDSLDALASKHGASEQSLDALAAQHGASKPPSALEDFWKAHANIANLARGTLATLPAVGAMTAGIAATPETLGGASIPAAALGAGMGRGLRDLIAEGLDLEPPTSPIVKAAKIALDTTTTAGTAMALKFVAAIVSQPRSALAEFLKRSVTPLQNVKDVAADVGAAPASGPILQRPPWQTWPQQTPAPLPRFSAQDVMQIKSLMDKGVPQQTAIDAVAKLRQMAVPGLK